MQHNIYANIRWVGQEKAGRCVVLYKKIQKPDAEAVICKSNAIISGNTNPMVIGDSNSNINYFLLGQCQDADRKVRTKLTIQLQGE